MRSAVRVGNLDPQVSHKYGHLWRWFFSWSDKLAASSNTLKHFSHSNVSSIFSVLMTWSTSTDSALESDFSANNGICGGMPNGCTGVGPIIWSKMLTCVVWCSCRWGILSKIDSQTSHMNGMLCACWLFGAISLAVIGWAPRQCWTSRPIDENSTAHS